MPEELKHIIEQIKPQAARPAVSLVLPDGSLVEMVYRPDEHRTLWCVWKDGDFRYDTTLMAHGQRVVPYSPRNNLLTNEVVLFPSEAAEYDSERALIEEIRAFIHRYVDVSPRFEELASYYVLFSWLYDGFNELPYLRIRGDTGSGKTRFLLTVGSLCYRPIFASGASTVSPLFRILDAMRGTLIIDEGDFRASDEKAEIVKILNNGNARGFPVLRSEADNSREFSPKAYAVFGPKLVATRGFFEDRALESRCLTEEVGGRRLRDEIPLNLLASYKQEALDLRNKLLLFRFRTFGKRPVDASLVDRAIEPRLAQIFAPLISVIEDAQARQLLWQLARDYHRDLIADRGMDPEAQLLEIIRNLLASGVHLSVKEITRWFADRHGEEYDWKITPKWVGYLLRKKLQLKPQKRHGLFVIPASEQPKLARLYERYGISPEERSGEGMDADEEIGQAAVQ